MGILHNIMEREVNNLLSLRGGGELLKPILIRLLISSGE